jgi:hypothetical protein
MIALLYFESETVEIGSYKVAQGRLHRDNTVSWTSCTFHDWSIELGAQLNEKPLTLLGVM